MVRVPINNVGAIGVIRDTDQPEHALPPNAFSSATNIRFQDNKAIKFTGHSAVFGTPTVAPEWAIAIPTSTSLHWLYASLTAVYDLDGSTHTDITRSSGAYTAEISKRWNGGLLGGIPIINNGVDVPQAWLTIAPTTKLTDLANWPSGVTAKVVKPFKQFLIALGIEKSSGASEFPHMVKWSHPADPGSVPSSWDETDATRDAGELDLTDVGSGLIRDGLALGDTFIIYKDGSTWGMQFIGGTSIFRTFKIFETTGILAQDCVAALPLGKGHFVATGDDLLVHDGQRAESVVDRKWRKYLSTNIDTDNFSRSYCITNYAQKEMWFCFPETGNTIPTLALTMSLVDGSIGVRDITAFSYIAQGPIDAASVGASWDSDTETWAEDSTIWGGQLYPPFVRKLLACDATNTKLYELDTTNQKDGSNITANLTRTGLAISGIDRSGKPTIDFTQRKLFNRIWPRMIGGPVNIRMGHQETPQDTVTWTTASVFTPGTDEFIDPSTPPAGRLLAVEFATTGNVSWELEGYDIEIELLGAQ